MCRRNAATSTRRNGRRCPRSATTAHPWAWNEIGFPGPAYPRGYSRFGSPHLPGGETETWEALEAFEPDPVRDTKTRGLD